MSNQNLITIITSTRHVHNLIGTSVNDTLLYMYIYYVWTHISLGIDLGNNISKDELLAQCGSKVTVYTPRIPKNLTITSGTVSTVVRGELEETFQSTCVSFLLLLLLLLLHYSFLHHGRLHIFMIYSVATVRLRRYNTVRRNYIFTI